MRAPCTRFDPPHVGLRTGDDVCANAALLREFYSSVFKVDFTLYGALSIDGRVSASSRRAKRPAKFIDTGRGNPHETWCDLEGAAGRRADTVHSGRHDGFGCRRSGA